MAVIPVTTRTILPVRRRDLSACIGVAVGAAARLTAEWRFVAAARPATATTASASAWFSSREFIAERPCQKNDKPATSPASGITELPQTDEKEVWNKNINSRLRLAIFFNANIYTMKKLLILLLSVLALTTFAQAPSWLDPDIREMDYPYSQYFTGYAEGLRTGSESIEAATKRLKDAARVEAASSIRTRVQNTTINQSLSQTLRTMEGTFRQSAREFSSATKTTVDIEIPGLQVESWRNPQTGVIAAFAYVKKSTLIRQLEKKITVGLTKIETSMDQIDQLVGNGQKMQARDLAAKALPQFVEVDEAQKILAAVDENADEESLQLQETRNLQHRLTGLIAQLKNGINIYISCHADMFGQNYSALKGEIEGALSSMGCTFVSSADQSDWAIYVTASAREYNKIGEGNNVQYFVYIDSKLSIDKTITGQRIYEEQFEPQKGAWTFSYVEAARRDGYKKVSKILIPRIQEQIQQ